MARPRRLYTDEKGKFYYIINKKRVFIKIPKGASQKQVQKVNVKTIVNLPETKRIKRRKKKVKPKFEKIPQKSLGSLLQKQTVGGLPYYIFREKQEIPTLDEISKGNKIKEEPKLTAMKSEPVIKTEPVILTPKKQETSKKIEVVDLTKTTPSSIFSFSNPFKKRTAKVLPEVESPPSVSLQIMEPTRVLDVQEFQPYFDYLKSEKRKNLDPARFPEFRAMGLPVPEEPAEYRVWEQRYKEARKQLLRNEPDFFDYKKGNPDFVGKGYDSDDGLYNDEIEKVMTKRIKDYVPVIPADKTDDLLKYVARSDKRFGAIINTQDSNSDGTGKNGNGLGHWTAVYINNEDDYPSIEYFDPLVEGDIPDRLYNSLRKIARKMNPEIYFKFKPNMIRRQNIKTSSCGWHSMMFLDNRYNGIPFYEASGYSDFIEQHKGADNSKDGEQDVEEYKKKYESYI